MTISDVCIIIWTQRHCSEQDELDEQVIVVKQICKFKTIVLHVMVCLWIFRVIVPLQLEYLHNQLSGHYALPLICCSVLFAIGSLPYIASYLCATTVWMHVCVSLYFMTGFDSELIQFILTNSLLLKVIGHCSLCLHCFYKETCLCVLYYLYWTAQ